MLNKPLKTIYGTICGPIRYGAPATIKAADNTTITTSNVVGYLFQDDNSVWIETQNTAYLIRQ